MLALNLQPQMFTSLDQLKNASQQIQVENMRSSKILKFKLKMIDICCIYHISYPTTQKKILKMHLVCQIIIKKVKTKLKAMSNEPSPYAALTRP